MPQYCKYVKDDMKCKKYASYGYPDSKSRLRCKTHAEENMIIVKKDNRTCIHSDHKDSAPRAAFNFPNEKRPIYCKAHSKEGMINLGSKNNRCIVCKKKQPSYGINGQKSTHCAGCALDNMVDLVSNLCKHEDCRTHATYGNIGKKAEYCKKHAKNDMIDVKNKRCIKCVELNIKHPKQPTYGINKPTHCFEHKTEEMIDCKHDSVICKEEDCNTRATYGNKDVKPLFCTNHKKDDMIDLVSLMCVKCTETQAVFGHNKNELYCKNCKENEMKNIVAKMCVKCEDKQPTYNYPKEKKGIYCVGCSLERMIDVVNPRCQSCQLFIVKKRGGLCVYCKPNSTIRQKTDEMIVVNYLKENAVDFIHNKSVGYVCGNYRPDVKIDAGTHVVIIEIDEDQHKQYDEICENTRMLNIHQAIGLRCVFLRYNPNVFRVNNKVKIVQKQKRLKILLENIKKYMEQIPEDEITVYRLFYNTKSVEDFVVNYEINVDIIKKMSNIL